MKKLLLVVSLLISGLLLSQKNADFATGYIVTAKNDTIKGEVKLNLKNEMDYYVKISFKDKPAGPARAYLPSKIHGYGVEGKDYASIRFYEMWVYMQVVCKGKIMFYEYKPPVALGNDKMQSQYFVLKGGFEEMTQIYMDGKIKKQIKEFIIDDKELWKETEPQTIDYAALVQLIEKYNSRNK
jgi:hypothetical protein